MSLKANDLKGVVLPIISLDEFNPKAGTTRDIIVIAFYVDDREPADDLNTFIQRGFIDTLDVDVSPSTDEDGHYLVFVEINRDETFPDKFKALIKDIENVTGKQQWKVKTYLSDDREFDYTDPVLYKFVITTPEKYITKDEFMKESIEQNIKEFLHNSSLSHLTTNGNTITISSGHNKIIAEVVDIGDYDTVIGRNFLSESAFNLGNKTMESRTLNQILGNYDISQLGKFLMVSNSENDKVLLLRNTEIKYRG